MPVSHPRPNERWREKKNYFISLSVKHWSQCMWACAGRYRFLLDDRNSEFLCFWCFRRSVLMVYHIITMCMRQVAAATATARRDSFRHTIDRPWTHRNGQRSHDPVWCHTQVHSCVNFECQGQVPSYHSSNSRWTFTPATTWGEMEEEKNCIENSCCGANNDHIHNSQFICIFYCHRFAMFRLSQWPNVTCKRREWKNTRGK